MKIHAVAAAAAKEPAETKINVKHYYILIGSLADAGRYIGTC